MSDWLIKFFKKTRQHSSVEKENSNQMKSNPIKSNIIKYISSCSTLQCNLIEGPFIYKVTGALGDLWGVTTKLLVHWGGGSEIKILKDNGGANEKRMCLKSNRSIWAIALSWNGILCWKISMSVKWAGPIAWSWMTELNFCCSK